MHLLVCILMCPFFLLLNVDQDHKLKNMTVKTVRRALTVETITTLVHELIISRVDYCNSVLYGASAVHLHSLQSVFNAAARIIVQKRKFDPITTTIRDELHWLPIKQRIGYKLSSSVYVELLRHI